VGYTSFELYDQSTVMEMISLEDLGFCQRGKLGKHIRKLQDYKGYYEIDGKKLFVNMNGGLKADGNPLGATGGAQILRFSSSLEAKLENDKSKR
jgi:acetyl-CoA C-acetyltransferase